MKIRTETLDRLRRLGTSTICNVIVTSIPREVAAEAADAAPEFVAAENVVLEAMQPPDPSVFMLRSARAESQNRIARLRLRVSRQPQ